MPSQKPAVPSPQRAVPPFGIGKQHVAPRDRGRLRTLMKLVFIGGPLLAALLGWLGSGEDGQATTRSPQAVLSVQTPRILRSGNWFETLVTVTPAVDVADLTIAIDQPLWRGMSIDTAVPDAEKVATTGGEYAYSFGPVKRGERFVFKLDGQIQPRGPRRLSGQIAARDGERLLAALPMTVQVLP